MKSKKTYAFLAAVILSSNLSHAEISIGDIAIIRVNNSSDSFSYVTLVNISGTETITWRDSSWNSASGGWRTTENTSGTFVAPATAGTIGNISSSGFNNGGEQIFLHQGDFLTTSTNDSAKIKFGINWDNAGWTTTSSSTSTSAQPTSLTGNNGSLALGTGDHWYYSGMLAGTSKTLLSAIANPANWTLAATTTATTYDGVRSGAAFTINSSASFLWDDNGSTAGTGGTGTWNTGSANKWSDSGNTTFLNNWVNSTTGNDHTAVFGGTAGIVTVSGGVTASGLTFDTTGYTIESSTVTLAGTAPTISVPTGMATISSALAGSNGLAKSGSGSLVLSGSNSYTGATSINAGSLIVNGSTGTSSAFTVASIATLGGSGTIGGNVTVSGTHAPGNSPGTQNVTGDLAYNPGSVFQWEITTGETPVYDKVIVGGTLTGSGATFNITSSTPYSDSFWASTKQWTDVFNKSYEGIFSTFSGTDVASNGLVADRGTFSITGSTLTWTAVPEASNLLIGGLVGLGLLSRRRKQA